jgi:L-threonylcarbamoyladenylate synthase
MAERFHTQLLRIHNPDLFQAAVAETVRVLRRGQTVALPTETVYGLAANALESIAVARLFEIKGRPAQNPVIVHVASESLARSCVLAWPPAAIALARAFWPGPLTLVLPKQSRIPDIVTAGGPTVGLRWPSHPFIQAVIQACEFPLAAPSANLSSQTSPTRAEHVRQSLHGRIPLIIDAGPCSVGIESTVVDLTTNPPRILRPGIIHQPALEAVVGPIESRAGFPETPHLRSPGLFTQHYAPRTPLTLLQWTDDHDLHRQLGLSLSSHSDGAGMHQPDSTQPSFCILAHTQVPAYHPAFQRIAVIPHDPEAYARALYAELHACDAIGADRLIVEVVPDEPRWSGIADRLRRASST